MEMNLHYVSANQFTNYSETSVTIRDQEYTDNILVTNDNVFDFAVYDISAIKLSDLELIIANTPDLVIFGSGAKIVYPNREIIIALQNMQIGVEVMPIQALCRTFNFLVSENRKVAALLLFSKP